MLTSSGCKDISIGIFDCVAKTQFLWANLFSRFDFYWIQTDKQTDRQAKYI